MANGFLDEYYQLEKRYGGKVDGIPENELNALRNKYTDEFNERSREPDSQVVPIGANDTPREREIRKLWKLGLTIDEMEKKMNLSGYTIRNCLAILGLPTNQLYLFKLTKGDTILFAHSKNAIPDLVGFKSKASYSGLVRRLKKNGWHLEFGTWREPDVKRAEKYNDSHESLEV